MKKLVVILTVGLLFLFPFSGYAQVVLGSWEYPGFGTVKMVKDGDSVHIIRYFNDGSLLKESLVVDEGEYISTTIRGQWYQIDMYGNLKMFDSYGLIRILKPSVD